MQDGFNRKTKARFRAFSATTGIVFFIFASGAMAEKPLPGTLPTIDPRPLALGGALRASASGTSGIYLNPATIAMVPLYHLELMYQYLSEEQMHMGGIAVVDSVTSIVAAGLSFNYSVIDQTKTDHEAYDGRLSLATKIGDMIFVGLTGRYLRVEQNTGVANQGPGGVSALPSSGNQQVDGFTFDAGAALRLGDSVALGIVGNNLTKTGSVFAPIQLGGGASVTLAEMITIEANMVWDFSSHDDTNQEIHSGVELFLAHKVALRAGYVYDFYFDLHSASAGLGYVDPAFALDAGFMKEIADDGRMALAVGFKYFIN
jgi:hypothetical protein